MDNHRLQNMLGLTVSAIEHKCASGGSSHQISTKALRDSIEAELGEGGHQVYNEWQADFDTVVDKLVEEHWLLHDPQHDTVQRSEQWLQLVAKEVEAHPGGTDDRVIARAVAEQLTKFGPRAVRLWTLRKRASSLSPQPQSPIAKRTRRSESLQMTPESKFVLPPQQTRSRAKSVSRKTRSASKPVGSADSPAQGTQNVHESCTQRKGSLTTIRHLEQEIDCKIETLRKLGLLLQNDVNEIEQKEIMSRIGTTEAEIDVLNAELVEAVQLAKAGSQPSDGPGYFQRESDAGLQSTSSMHIGTQEVEETIALSRRAIELAGSENGHARQDSKSYDENPCNGQEGGRLVAMPKPSTNIVQDESAEAVIDHELAQPTRNGQCHSQDGLRSSTVELMDLPTRSSAALLKRELHAALTTNKLYRAENRKLQALHAFQLKQTEDLQRALARATADQTADIEEQRATYAQYDLELANQAASLVKAEEQLAKLKASEDQMAFRIERLNYERAHMEMASLASIQQHRLAVQSLEEALERAELEHTDLQDEAQAVKAKLEEAAEHCKTLEAKVDDAGSALAEKEATLTKLQERLAALEAADAKAQSLEKELTSAIQSAAQSQTELERMSNAFEQRIERIAKDYEVEKQASRALHEALSSARKESEESQNNLKREHENKLTRTEQQLTEHKKSLAIKQEEVTNLEQNNALLKQELMRGTDRVRELEGQVKDLSDNQEKTIEELAQRRLSLEYVLNTFADLEGVTQRFVKEHASLTRKALEGSTLNPVGAEKRARERGDDSGIGFAEFLEVDAE